MQYICLYVGLDDSYSRGIARGVIRYAKHINTWRLFGYGWMFADMNHIENNMLKADGIIARIENKQDAKHIAHMAQDSIPVIDIAGAYDTHSFLRVINDDTLTGLQAGHYLHSLGHRYFAYAGVKNVIWSAKRFQGFSNAIQEKIPRFEKPLVWWEEKESDTTELAHWLTQLPKPLALFACNDTAGLKISTVCKEVSIHIPKDIAVIGVDNEDLLCELAQPSLTSISLNCEAIGNKAAEILHQALEGNIRAQQGQVLIAPGTIIERESSKIIIMEDTLTSAALTFIRTNAYRNIHVEDVLNVVSASRRNLEQRFKKNTGRTLHEEIQNAKLEYAKNLLCTSNITIENIAQKSGFPSVQRFYTFFKESERMTPNEWRRFTQKNTFP